MITIKITEWQTGTPKENDTIKYNWDVFKSELYKFKPIINGSGTVSFTNNNFDKTKISFVERENKSTLSTKEWIDLLSKYFSSYIYD